MSTATDLSRLHYADIWPPLFTTESYSSYNQFQGIYRGKQYHEPDFAEVLQRAQEYGCQKIILTTTTLARAHENLKIVQQYPDICTMTLGVHPYHAAEIYQTDGKTYLDALRALCNELLAHSPSPLVAFGEIRLDYAYLQRSDKETQQRAFRDQLDIAVGMQLPLFLHVRDSCADVVEIITSYLSRLPRGGLVHSFAGTKDEMLQLVALGLGISGNGVSFRTEEQLEMVKRIPLDRLQLETGAPWCEIVEDERIAPFLARARPLPPTRKHGKFIRGQMVKGRNESCRWRGWRWLWRV
ncbi:TatD family hydrolase [Aspergillus thermomutatus]|uniref:TatD DNase n=1 Tax=Aspergillus thermomutatus TaxID=41047 RepID=A0A397GDS4_ASPTH|nr:uncharacterized protein CDV56_102997 [Aspergillus thermomutatus]RHZ49182.1 hypothetical protein CDV56_102997 [Aspergillus thermomutatus]